MSSIDNSELKTLLQRKVAILELGEFQPFFAKNCVLSINIQMKIDNGFSCRR